MSEHEWRFVFSFLEELVIILVAKLYLALSSHTLAELFRRLLVSLKIDKI